MEFQFKMTGLAELQRKLEQMPRDVARKVIRGALKESAEEMREHFVAHAPKRSGFLSQHFNVKLRIRGDELAGTAFIGPAGKMYYPGVGKAMHGSSGQLLPATGKHPKHGGLIPVASVARFLEFGTSKMSAKPFMRPTFESRKEWALRNIIDDIKAGIAKWVK